VKSLPLVSFIIPALNSSRTIDRCLNSIVSQRYPRLEVIVVDNGSKDETLNIASKYADVILERPKGTVGYLRQEGVQASKGEILGIFDSDIYLPHENWLFNAIQPFIEDDQVGIVWPYNIAPKRSTAITRCYLNFSRTRFDRQGALPGGNSLILRKAIDEVRGFNTRLHGGEDMDLCFRIVLEGYKAVKWDEPIIHDTMRSLREFTRKDIIRSATMIDYEKRGSKINLLYACMTFRLSPVQQSSQLIMMEGAVDHVLIALKSMAHGFKEDYANGLIPLLLSIRLFIYGLYYLRFLAKMDK